MTKKRLIYRMEDTTRMMDGIDHAGDEDGIGGPAAQCYRAGNHVYITGQTGYTLQGELKFPYDPARQAKLACENIKQLMEMAGGSMADIVRYVIYVTDRAYRALAYPVIRSYWDPIPPCGTGLIVDGLARPELCVEIDAWGFIDDPE